MTRLSKQCRIKITQLLYFLLAYTKSSKGLPGQRRVSLLVMNIQIRIVQVHKTLPRDVPIVLRLFARVASIGITWFLYP